MVRQMMIQTGASALIIVAVLYAGVVGAHGKVAMEQDNCVRQVGESIVHLSAYQPQYEPSDQYCTEIPLEGDTLLVVDLVDQALREMPVGVRVVRGTNETEDETVAYLRPSYHPDGVIRGETNLDQGLYTVFITAEGLPPVHYQYPLRVKMVNYANIFRQAVVPLIAMLLLTLLGYKLMKSRQLQNSRSSRRP